MKTYVEFRSSHFPPYEGEQNDINLGRYGKRLAESLVRGLREKGFEPQEPVADDWGWVIRIKNDGFPLWIGCGNYEEYPDGFLCFIEPHQPKIRRFPFLRTQDTSRRVAALQQAIDELLVTNSTITDKRWWTYDEFNHQGS